MREIPIIFNTEMVKSILRGNKVCTRRPVEIDISNKFDLERDGSLQIMEIENNSGFVSILDLAPYQTGDLLYVRETWCRLVDEGFAVDENIVKYKTDGEIIFYNIGGKSGKITPKWKPSIHMPKKYARIWLKVTDVRVERVSQIKNWDSNPWVWVIDFEGR